MARTSSSALPEPIHRDAERVGFRLVSSGDLQQRMAALLLSGLLTSGLGIGLVESVQAAPLFPANPSVAAKDKKQTTLLPRSLANLVLQDAAQRLNRSTRSLQIAQAERQTWSDGCLGLAQRDVLCTQALVPGWRVVVEGGQRRLVYRTNTSGSVIKLDTTASQISDAGNWQPVRLASADLPPAPARDVVFQVVSSGGIAGLTHQITLFRDGRLVKARLTGSGAAEETQIDQLSRQQVRQFEQLLKQQGFEQFHGLSYPAPSGAADFITVTLISRSGTTRYADLVQGRLPQSLQQVIRSWDRLVGNVSSKRLSQQ